MLWRSTLFITNFPREMDDAAIKYLFGNVCLTDTRRVLTRQYGLILHSRWPSRKYADARRFCYITMESPVSIS